MLLAAISSGSSLSPWEMIAAIASIVVIDIVLAGDNAVVIALAVRSLQARQRMLGITLGAGLAVALRIALTFITAHLLTLNYIKLTGGVLILWIAGKLLLHNTGADTDARHQAGNLWSAIWIILVADVTMSLDNVLAVAAASKGSLVLLIFGLGLSIPLVVFTSSLLAKLMDRYPIIIWIGAAILGKVGGEMILTDPAVAAVFQPTRWMVHTAEILGAAGVVVLGLYVRRRHAARTPTADDS